MWLNLPDPFHFSARAHYNLALSLLYICESDSTRFHHIKSIKLACPTILEAQHGFLILDRHTHNRCFFPCGPGSSNHFHRRSVQLVALGFGKRHERVFICFCRIIDFALSYQRCIPTHTLFFLRLCAQLIRSVTKLLCCLCCLKKKFFILFGCLRNATLLIGLEQRRHCFLPFLIGLVQGTHAFYHC